MATSFPSSLDSLSNPSSGDSLSSPSHSGQHADANDAIEALEAKVGVDGSAVTTSLDYKVTASKAVTDKVDPSGATTNQVLKYNGTKFVPSTGASVTVSDTPPTSPTPQAGDQWYESDTGRQFIYYDSVWVEIGNATDIAGVIQPKQITDLTAVTSLTSDDVFAVVDNPSSAVAANKITFGNLATSIASGLVLIKTQTIGSAVASVNVTGAFSSTYDNYLIQISNTVVSANQPNLGIQLGSTTTNYAYSGHYQSFASATLTGDVTTTATYFNIGACGNGTVGNGRISMDVQVNSPNIAAATFFNARNGSLQWNNYYNGYLNNSTQYTDFTILPSSGNLTGGTIRVYGYRNS